MVVRALEQDRREGSTSCHKSQYEPDQFFSNYTQRYNDGDSEYSEKCRVMIQCWAGSSRNWAGSGTKLWKKRNENNGGRRSYFVNIDRQGMCSDTVDDDVGTGEQRCGERYSVQDNR